MTKFLEGESLRKIGEIVDTIDNILTEIDAEELPLNDLESLLPERLGDIEGMWGEIEEPQNVGLMYPRRYRIQGSPVNVEYRMEEFPFLHVEISVESPKRKRGRQKTEEVMYRANFNLFEGLICDVIKYNIKEERLH